MQFDLSSAEVAIVRQALMLRSAQLRRAINTETDSAILAIRQQQFKIVDTLVATFAEVR
jgi:hypothetical protein